MSAAQPIDPRKAEIVRRHRAGESGAAIARSMGVSRQYIHALLKRVEAAGDEVGLRRGRRGRKKDLPLTADQRAALCAHLRSGQGAMGARADLTDKAVRTWFRDRFDRPLTVHQLRRVCTEEGLKLARPEASGEVVSTPGGSTEVTPETVPSPAPTRRRGRPRKDAPAAPPERLEEEALEAMRRSNEEVAARIARERGTPPPPVRRPAARRRRNDPCPFDPNLKFKRCCGARGSSWCLREAEGEGRMKEEGTGD